MNVSISPGKYL